MRKYLLASVAFVAFGAAQAAAADLAARTRTPAPPPTPAQVAPIWSGFYIGGNIGGGWGTSRHDPTTGMSTGNFDLSGVLGGGTLGYNWQTGPIVYGIETDFDFSDIKGSAHCPNPAFSCRTRNSWLGTTRGRIGWTPVPAVLLYGTGGVAYGDIHASVSPPNPGTTGGQTGDKAGWTAGAGVEWMFARNWSAKVEYLHVDLGSFTCEPGSCGLIPSTRVKFDADLARFGLNYKFY